MGFSFEDYIKDFCNDGFLIPEFKIEIPLYRYRGTIRNVIDEIENDHIYMAPLNELNDPFDSAYAVSFEEFCSLKQLIELFYVGSYFLTGMPWYKQMGEHIREKKDERCTLTEYAEIVSNFARKHGDDIAPIIICKQYYQKDPSRVTPKRRLGKVASFSETWESIPMWSYYADSHKGVCMKYELSMLDPTNTAFKRIIHSMRKVWYSEQRFSDSKSAFTPFVKSLQWAHEQEWRLFRESKEKYLYIPCLSEILLGINMEADHVDEIINSVKKNGRDIKISFVTPKADTYGMKLTPLTN